MISYFVIYKTSNLLTDRIHGKERGGHIPKKVVGDRERRNVNSEALVVPKQLGQGDRAGQARSSSSITYRTDLLVH